MSFLDQPRWWHIPAAIGCCVVFVVGIIQVQRNHNQNLQQQQQQQRENLQQQQEEQAAEEARQQEEWRLDAIRQEQDRQAAIPNLVYITHDGPRADGYTYLEFKNTSPTRNAVITSLALLITDPKQQQLIKKHYPKPREFMMEAAVNQDEVRLINSIWTERGFLFHVTPYVEIPADRAQVFKTCIVNKHFNNVMFTGTFEILVEGADGHTLHDTKIRSRIR